MSSSNVSNRLQPIVISHRYFAARGFGEYYRHSVNVTLAYFVSFDVSSPEQRSSSPPHGSTSPVPSSGRWVVRIPIVPRLGCADEKHRSEVATMKYATAFPLQILYWQPHANILISRYYLLEKSDVPTPKPYGYSLTDDNPIGTPFMIIEYVCTSTLCLYRLKSLRIKDGKNTT